MLPVTGPFAALLALLLLALSVRVIRERSRVNAPLGDGGDARLRRAMRAQGNCAEYTPLGLLLMAVAELNGAAAWLLYLVGAALLAGRLLHALAITRDPEPLRARVAAMALTFTALGLAAMAATGALPF
jgi:uncharacterized membrane protein YecN with MAPEG domain